jgi:NADPH:quinone reductase-like Zn-dependent oxidoreductase
MIDTNPSADTMRGWAINAYGEDMVLMDDLPVPQPGPHDVLIKMRGAEVGDWDELVRTGEWDMERPFPLVLGLGGAGTVAAVGAKVTSFTTDHIVYAYSYPLYDNGAWAEYMLVPEHYAAHVPTSLPPVEAGGLPVVGLTAHECLIDLLKVQDGDIVLVTAAAGGVGHLAVQIASLLGARVVATASKRNHDFLTNLGAETVIDYAAVDDVAKAILARYPGGVDKCLNGVSNDTANDYVWALKEGGMLIDLPGAVKADRPGVEIVSDYVVRGDGARLAALAKLFDDGGLQLAIHDTVAFADAPDALAMALSKHVRGKVVLDIT